MNTRRIPVVDGLFAESADGARLLGSRCTTCRTPYFPASSRCHHPDCASSDVEEASFGPGGTLWSFSVQNYPPPSPALYDEPYSPYAIAVVDLDDGLRVVGRMAGEADGLAVGARVEVVLGALRRDDGVEQISWMFRPV